jgi:hypothetical protein
MSDLKLIAACFQRLMDFLRTSLGTMDSILPDLHPHPRPTSTQFAVLAHALRQFI